MSKSPLSSRQRMLAAIRREKLDHVPFSPYVPQGPWFKGPLFWMDQIERAEKLLALELDPTIDIWLPDPQPAKEVQIKACRVKKGKEIILTKEYHTPAGVLRQVVRETEDWCRARHGPWVPTTWGIEKLNSYNLALFDDYNVSRRLEPWVKGPEDLDKLRYVIGPPSGCALDEWRMDARRAIEFAQRLDLLTVVRRTIVGDAYQWFCDIPWFLTQLYDAPDFVKKFFGIFQNWAKAQIELAVELEVDVLQYRGWYETPTFLGPKFWREYIGPYINEQAAIVHSTGKVLTYLLPEGQGAYAADLQNTQVDVLQGVDPRKLHGGQLSDLFGKCGQTKSFWGGVNAEVTLASKDYSKIEAEVKLAIDSLGAGGGMILSAFLFPEVPLEAIMHMIAAWKKHRQVSPR